MVVAVATASCTTGDDAITSTTAGPDWFMAAEGPPTTVLAALATGPISIDVEARCVWVEAQDGLSYPLVFPVRTVLDEETGTIRLPDQQTLRNGDIVEMAGGSYPVSRLNDEEYRSGLQAPSGDCWGALTGDDREVWEINGFSEIVVLR